MPKTPGETSKKVLLVITKSNFGGAQRYVFDLATRLTARGHNVVVASGGSGELIDRLAEAGITHRSIAGLQRDIGLYQELRSLFSFAHIIHEEDPDIVHLNSSKAGITGSLIARLLGVPMIVFTAHGWAFREDRSKVWKLLVYLASWLTGLLAHRVIAVSQADYASTPSTWVRTHTTVIHPSIDAIDLIPKEQAREELLPDYKKDDSALWIGTLAELTSNKNLTHAINTIVTYNQNHDQTSYRYIILGGGEQTAELQTLIKQLGAEGYIHLLGHKKDARRHLAAFDVFLLPSKKEGLPYVLLEAAHASLPRIASKVGGIPEIVTHEVDGYLIDPYEPAELTAALQYCANQATRQRLGTTAKQRINRWNVESMVTKTLAVYTDKRNEGDTVQ
ncbi:MAG: glycosyltransferase family 4 protein [Candidatus Paceibacterota bacterium]